VGTPAVILAGDGKAVILQQVLQISGRLDFEERNFGQVPELPGDLLNGGSHLFYGLDDFFVLCRDVRAGLGNRLQEGDDAEQQCRDNFDCLFVICSH